MGADTYHDFELVGRDLEGKLTVQTGILRSLLPSQLAVENARVGYIAEGYYQGQYREFRSPEFQWVRYRDPNWREREEQLFRQSQLISPPWALPRIEDHFAAISQDGQSITFFTNEVKGMINDRTSTKVGRYLTKHYPDLTGDQIRQMVCDLDRLDKVQFTPDPDLIEKIYVNGPNSCMSYEYPGSNWMSHIHPVRVYGGGDLQLAYIESSPGKYSARCLVWPEKKLFNRIYGDEHRMTKGLLALGYEHSDTLKGARIRAIEDGDGYVLPYLDCSTDGAYLDSKDTNFLVIDKDVGRYVGEGDRTDGLSYEPENMMWCPYLERNIPDDSETIWVSDRGEYWSSEAVEGCAVFHCDYTGEYYSNEAGRVEMANGDVWCALAFADVGGRCAKTGGKFDLEEMVTLADTEELVSPDWAEENAFYHEGEYFAEAPIQTAA